MNVQRQEIIKRTAWITGWIVFGIGLYISAKLGIQAAKSKLPAEALKGASYPMELTLMAGAQGEALYFAEDRQKLRDFFFRYPSPEQRRQGDAEAGGVRRLFGPIQLHTFRQDADLVRVRLLSGSLNGREYWIQLSQLPPAEEISEPGEDPETGSESEAAEDAKEESVSAP